MNTTLINAIANAVLYEGYMLYPYRASSIKNRQRFNFGVLYPRFYSEAQSGSDAWSMQTGMLMTGNSQSAVEVRVRFLKLVSRSPRKPNFEPVSSLEVDGKVFSSWQEAVECEVVIPPCNLHELTLSPYEKHFHFPAKEDAEPLRDRNNQMAGVVVRTQDSICGTIEIFAERPVEEIFKIRIFVRNLTSLGDDGESLGRDRALARSLVSAHVVLGAVDGQFVSLLDPPDDLKDLAATCQNVGAWPVLVGTNDQRDTVLASPIILYDYPQIAPESPGDLFDGTEIDEILALRIMTMTDAEKNEMRNTDERARQMLERTESLPAGHLMKLHGTLRELHSLKEEMS
jgi:hydrogenase maturation protease